MRGNYRAMGDTIGVILRNKGADIWSVTPDATVYEAIALMAAKGIGAVLVLKEGELAGILSERDYARKVILQGRSSRETFVHEIMTATLITVTPEHTVADCMRIITQHRIRHLPVLECGRLTGMVSIGDLVNAIISDQAHTIDQLQTYITHKYPA